MRTDGPKSRPRRARSTASRIVTSRKRTLPDDASAYGRSGQDEVFGFVGDEFLSGGQGSDIVGKADDTGNDIMKGGQGEDALDGGPGLDTLDGGPQTDVCINGEVVRRCP
jgi:Ca2+-binding RTX toxin-like protein